MNCYKTVKDLQQVAVKMKYIQTRQSGWICEPMRMAFGRWCFKRVTGRAGKDGKSALVQYTIEVRTVLVFRSPMI